MKINFFEGGRRLVILVQALIFCWAVGFIFFSEPYVSVIYEITYPADSFRLSIDQTCDDLGNDASETITRIAENGKIINIKLCFKGSEFSRTDKNGALTFDDLPTMGYIKEKSNTFVLSQEGYSKYKEIWWKTKFKQIKEVAQYSFFSIIGLTIFSMILGWIVRGFFGIKSGKDFREEVK